MNIIEPDDDRLAFLRRLTLQELVALESSGESDLDLLIEIGKRHLKDRRFDTAEEYYHRALLIDPNEPWSHLYMGNLLYTQDKYCDAIWHFEFAANILKTEPCPYWCLGDAHDANGDRRAAGTYYNKAVQVAPDDQTAIRRLSDWTARQDEPE